MSRLSSIVINIVKTGEHYVLRGYETIGGMWTVDLWRKDELIYFGSPELWPFEDYFTTLDARQNELLKRFKESGAQNYVEWLESQIEV